MLLPGKKRMSDHKYNPPIEKNIVVLITCTPNIIGTTFL